jgi:hypothetical protein
MPSLRQPNLLVKRIETMSFVVVIKINIIITSFLAIFSIFMIHQRVIFCRALVGQIRQFRLSKISRLCTSTISQRSQRLSSTQSESIDSYGLNKYFIALLLTLKLLRKKVLICLKYFIFMLTLLINIELPPILKGYVEGFRKVQDDKLRYQQLLFLASKSSAYPDYLKIPENKVPGCLSTVYVHATMDDESEAITFLGESDSQLTKGLKWLKATLFTAHFIP